MSALRRISDRVGPADVAFDRDDNPVVEMAPQKGCRPHEPTPAVGGKFFNDQHLELRNGESSSMTGDSSQLTRPRRADIVAEDNGGKVVLIVELKGMSSSGDLGVLQVLDYLTGSDVLFGMFADFDEIVILRKDFEDPRSPVLEKKTSEILSFYDPGFGSKRISEEYFATLIESWLRDYAFHWRSERPPAYEEMRAIGLAERLEGGMTRREVVDVDDPLH